MTRRSTPHNRIGSAPLEFVLFLPLLLLAWAMMVSVGHVGVAHTHASVSARHAAFEGRARVREDSGAYASTSPLSGASLSQIGNVFGGARGDADRGVLKNEHRRPIDALFPHLRGVLPDAHSRVELLAGSWDARSLSFTDAGPLALQGITSAFTDHAVSRGAFLDLIGFGSAIPADALATINAANSEISKNAEYFSGGGVPFAGDIASLQSGAQELLESPSIGGAKDFADKLQGKLQEMSDAEEAKDRVEEAAGDVVGGLKKAGGKASGGVKKALGL